MIRGNSTLEISQSLHIIKNQNINLWRRILHNKLFPIIFDAHFFNETVLISAPFPALRVTMNLSNTLFFTSLYLRYYPIRLLTQNSTISLNLRVSGGGLRCKASLWAIHGPRSQIDFSKYNIMRILYRNNWERSSPSVNTNHADSTSRLQMCASVEHRYWPSLVLKIEFLFKAFVICYLV